MSKGKPAAISTPNRSRRIGVLLLVCTLLTTGVVVAMGLLDIPLGERGKMEYRYSSVVPLRAARVLPGLAGLAAAAVALHLLGNGRRRLGLAAGAAALALLCGWTWYQPPQAAYQHLFNLMSPSQDGAFVLEMEKVGPMQPYLQRFEFYLRRTPEDIYGTRVLSNPPGMTILSAIVAGTVSMPVPPGTPERAFLSPDLDARQVHDIVVRIRLSLVLTLALGLSGIFAYLLGRQFLSSMGAMVFAVLLTINPATANFSPGKDPAQLLTINAMLWLWFSAGHGRGRRRGQMPLRSALAGAVLVVGAVFGLIHLWVALAAVLATAWKAAADAGTNRTHVLAAYGIHRVAPAAIGAILIMATAYLAVGWNIPLTLAAVARRFGEIQHTIQFTRPFWAVIGLPLFLLFVSPAVFTLASLSRPWRVRKPTWGTCILLSTVAVMGLTYVIGVTYELPRLWIAFLPLLTLGACADWALLKGVSARQRAGAALTLIVTVHLLTTFLHVALLDARETEYRMMQQKLFGEPPQKS